MNYVGESYDVTHELKRHGNRVDLFVYLTPLCLKCQVVGQPFFLSILTLSQKESIAIMSVAT